MKKRMLVLLFGFVLVGCSANSEGSNPEGNNSESENDVVYETYERAALEEDIMDGNTLERYAAVDCDVVEVKMISQDQKEEVIDTDREEEIIEFALYEMEIQDVVSSSDLSVGDTIVIAVADWMSEEYPIISADMTYIIPVYKADEESVNVGDYLIADYSLFYVIDKTDGTQTIKAAYVEDESYDGLSVEEFKGQLAALKRENIDPSTEDTSDTENTTISVDTYSLTGEPLVQKTAEADASDTSTDYVVYTDDVYDYYFDEDMTALRYVLSNNSSPIAAEVDTMVLIEQASKYIEQINALDDFTDDDWVVDESIADGMYTLDLYKTVYGENISVATFYFIGEELSSIVLEIDVMEYEDAGTELIDKEAAVEQAESLLVTAYGDTYTNYVDDLDDDATTASLNVHGGDLYWYITVTNGEYGGFVAEINAVTGECNYMDQSK